MSNFEIRLARLEDLSTVTHIYNHEVTHGTATWNFTVQPVSDFEGLFLRIQSNHQAFFVVEDLLQKRVVGYACYEQFRSIQGFYKTIEHSVFLHHEYVNKGLGSRLLHKLIETAKEQDLHVMVAAIDAENTASIHLHHKFGFIQTGYMPEVGEKFGQWRDLVLMQLKLN